MGYIREVVFLLAIVALSGAQANKAAAPAECQIWKVPVEVDPPKHDHIPYYVEMHRCMGQCTGIASISPLRCECVPATTQDVTLRVTTPTGFNLKTFKNHTSCTSQCKASYKNKCQQDGHNWDENTCTCSCPQPRTTSGTCPQNQVWNTRSCQCECPRSPASCSLNMAWNKSSCSCQCSVMAFAKCSKNGWATDLKTCRCVRRRRPVIPGQVSNTETNESQTKLVVSLVVIALLLGTLFIIDSVLLFSRKGFMYGMYRLVTKCKEKKTKEDFINEVEAAEAAETVSIRFDMERSESCKHKSHDTTQDPVADV